MISMGGILLGGHFAYRSEQEKKNNTNMNSLL